MNFRTIWISVATLLVGLPVVILLATIVTVSLLDRSNGSIVSSGLDREYLLYVPPGYDGRSPVPLVVSLHAGAAWPAQQKNMSRWNRLADEEIFIVVYPAGAGEIGALDMPRIWAVERDADRTRDLRFMADLIESLSAAYHVDPNRVYANGMSQGGAMAFALSCALPDRIAAVGMVAAAQAWPFDACTDQRPVPMIAFHGTADPIVPYDGGPLGDPFNPVKPIYPAIRDFAARWARRNRCGSSPVRSVVAEDLTRVEFTECARDAAVVLYTIEGAGHIWPGGKALPEWWVGPTSDGVDATRVMWAFFREYPRGEARAVDATVMKGRLR